MAKLIFRYGSMNASKSANLIMDWYGHKANGKSVLTFKSTLDARDYGYITSRAIETKIPASLIAPDMDGVMFNMTETFMPRMVFIDEVQFLTAKQIEELSAIVDKLGVTVQAYGLMTDFKRELFEGSKRLVELADVVERIRSECTECSNEGLMNARFIDGVLQSEGQTVMIGAEQTYKVLCRSCYAKSIERLTV
ncbi:thymidine kinase [Paenibacillus sp. Mc5Re-14]|uniref:thymidine kinase n=1 Tax=Paenibacillus sp. Mc5Re-14 TaxID=1030529 RepID=UPI000AA990BC|nr:thymidine kinase [Paenibacillus sp. Mc5Re-14]